MLLEGYLLLDVHQKGIHKQVHVLGAPQLGIVDKEKVQDHVQLLQYRPVADDI